MRLITRHIYRAFPELDRFSDEQSRRFVQVAARGAIHRGIRYGLTALAWWIVALAIFVWVDYIYIRIDFDPYAAQSVFLSVVSTIVPAAIGMFAAFQCALGVRDSLLRRSVRRVVNSRGRCHTCDYVLLGLPVGSDLKVRCPECGQDVEVDPSLGELVSGHPDAPVFRPIDDRFDPAAMARLSRRRRRIIGWSVSVAAIIIGVPLFVVGAWLFGLHQQAMRAAAARVTYGQLAAVVAQASPPDMDVPPDLQSDLPELLGVQAQRVTQIAADEISTQYGHNIYVDIRCYLPVPVPGTKPEIIALQQREREVSRIAAGVVINRLRSTGWMQRAEMLPSVRRTGWIRNQSSVKLISRNDLDETAFAMRGIAKVNFARMQFASETQDTEEYAAALEQALAAARLAAREPDAGSWRTAASIETIAMSIVRNHLREPRSAQWVERVRKVLAEHEPVSAMPLFDAYVLGARDRLAGFFSDVWDVCDYMSGRQRSWSVSAYVFVAGDVQYVGSLEENLLEVDRLAEKWRARIEMEPWQITEPPPQSEKRLALVSWAFPFSAKVERNAGERMLNRRGVEIMLAIESFRHHHGQYPRTLDELLSEGVSADTLRDPYSGRNFGYCLADPVTDPLNRSYLLWSVGYDKTDNGGTLHPEGKSSFALDRWNSEGSDYIINQPE
jgi:hypothetical protein